MVSVGMLLAVGAVPSTSAAVSPAPPLWHMLDLDECVNCDGSRSEVSALTFNLHRSSIPGNMSGTSVGITHYQPSVSGASGGYQIWQDLGCFHFPICY